MRHSILKQRQRISEVKVYFRISMATAMLDTDAGLLQHQLA